MIGYHVKSMVESTVNTHQLLPVIDRGWKFMNESQMLNIKVSWILSSSIISCFFAVRVRKDEMFGQSILASFPFPFSDSC
jgi:hypothetical protein